MDFDFNEWARDVIADANFRIFDVLYAIFGFLRSIGLY